MILRSGERLLTKGAKLAIVGGTVCPSTAPGMEGSHEPLRIFFTTENREGIDPPDVTLQRFNASTHPARG
jgi:hypothetical protein